MVTGPALGFLALFPVAALARGAVAPAGDPIPIHVEFDAPAGCSSVDAFFAGVMARSDRARRAGAGDEGVRLGVRLTRSGGRVQGELRVLDAHGDLETRKVEGGRCDEVVEVLSLTAALTLDPAARVASVPPPAAPAGSPASGGPAPSASPPASPPPEPPPAPPALPAAPRPPAPPPAVETAREAAPAVGAPLGFSLGAAAVGGETVSPSLGGSLSVRIERAVPSGRGASLALAGFYLSSEVFGGASELAARFAALAMTACPGWSLGTAITIEPCAQATGGWLSVTDRAVTNPNPVGRTWGSVGALARAALRVGAGFSLELEAGLAVPLVERRFITTTPERRVGQTPPISGTVGLGIVWGT